MPVNHVEIEHRRRRLLLPVARLSVLSQITESRVRRWLQGLGTLTPAEAERVGQEMARVEGRYALASIELREAASLVIAAEALGLPRGALMPRRGESVWEFRDRLRAQEKADA